MAIAVTMPRFGQDQTEGVIVEWFKEEGDRVERGEPLLAVETAKTTMEVEAPADGVLLGVKYEEGDAAPVNAVIAYLGQEGEAIPKERSAPDTESAPAATPSTVADEPPAHSTGRSGRIRATPAARKLAREKKIDVSLVTGTGSGGLITPEDVRAFVAPVETPPSSEPEGAPLTKMRKAIAASMQASWQTAPHITFTVAIDMTAAEARRAEWNQGRADEEPTLSVTGLLVKAVAGLLSKHPSLNASLHDENLVLHNRANIGVAVALDEGLIVPVVHEAEGLSLEQVVSEIDDLSRKARDSRLTPGDVAEGTFTISNLGMFGIEQFTAIINPPESAILAVGRTGPEVVVVDGMLGIRSLMRVTLSVDHRVADGAHAGRFLSDLKAVLERPNSLFDTGVRGT